MVCKYEWGDVISSFELAKKIVEVLETFQYVIIDEGEHVTFDKKIIERI